MRTPWAHKPAGFFYARCFANSWLAGGRARLAGKGCADCLAKKTVKQQRPLFLPVLGG